MEALRTVQQRAGDRVDVAGPAGRHSYRHGGLPKACLHPLTTPAGGCITGFEMSDHVWHRGLWFTIKIVNGENFWEENDPFGVQQHAADPAVAFPDNDTVRLSATVDWVSPSAGTVLKETRRIDHRALRPGIAAVDWSCRLLATKDLTLDRTPYTTWGGYGGLILRTSREFHNARLLRPGGEKAQGMAGQTGDWLLMNGSLDGGKDVRAGFGFVDHPSNPRSPTPWYAKTGPEVNFINAAFLFAAPMTLAEGESLTFRYRVLVRDGHWQADEFADLAGRFRDLTPEAL